MCAFVVARFQLSMRSSSPRRSAGSGRTTSQYATHESQPHGSHQVLVCVAGAVGSTVVATVCGSALVVVGVLAASVVSGVSDSCRVRHKLGDVVVGAKSQLVASAVARSYSPRLWVCCRDCVGGAPLWAVCVRRQQVRLAAAVAAAMH